MYDSVTASGWYNETTVHPIGLIALIIAGAATFLVPRRYALVPMLMVACFIAPAQRIVFATLDFNFLRVMVLLTFARLLLRGETAGTRWTYLDGLVVGWAVCAMVGTALLSGTLDAFVNRLGYFYDAIGLYFICRIVIRSFADVRLIAVAVALISIPVAMTFLVEKMTGRNMFAIFGGVPEITVIREGRLRCRGPFSHPILAGCFWASLMPLMIALWWCKGQKGERSKGQHPSALSTFRLLAVIGAVCSMIVIITCASATPLGGVVFGFVAVLAWPLRHHLAIVRWACVLGVIALQLIMHNPIWHLFTRMNFVAGSTGWYRYKLLDEFFQHFSEWWLLGTTQYESWWEGGFEAITNEYVLQGVNGGLLTLALFVAVIWFAFRAVGRTFHQAEQLQHERFTVRVMHDDGPTQAHLRANRSSADVAMAWALGASLLIHVIVFSGVSYFGQTILAWYITLGCIGSMMPAARQNSARLPRLRLRFQSPETPGRFVRSDVRAPLPTG